MPAFDGGDNFVGIDGPGEGFCLSVVLVEEAVDGCLEVCDRAEDAALEPALRELGEEALDRIEPGARSRREVEGEAFVAGEPLAHHGMLVGGVVVEDHMHDLAGGKLDLDGVQEANKLLMPMALHVAADHRAVDHVKRGEHRGRSMAFVVVGHGPGAALFERQAGLGAVERLDLALPINREHDGVGGRTDIETDEINLRRRERSA